MLDRNVHLPRGVGPVHAALDAAVRGIAGLVSIDEVLQVVVDRVRPLVGAQYAALGIVDAAGRIERFITRGMDEPPAEVTGHLLAIVSESLSNVARHSRASRAGVRHMD